MKLIYAAAALAAGITISGAANAAIVFSEDFSGYTLPAANGPHTADVSSTSHNSFTTDYSFRTGAQNTGANSMYDEGTWTITTNPYSVHNLWIDQPQPNDPFLILNGNTTPNVKAYESNAIDVGPGTYRFSYDILNVCCNSAHDPNGVPPFLQLWYFKGVDDTTPVGPINIGTQIKNVGSSHGWFNVSGNCTISAPGGYVRLGLSDFNGAADGNDFGVDNIKLATVPEPASWALMIVGFGSAGAMLRRRRQGAATA
jgi:hypothetical protein